MSSTTNLNGSNLDTRFNPGSGDGFHTGSPQGTDLNSLNPTPIDIFRNSLWTGSGLVKNGRLVECYSTQLGKNGQETEAIYEAIERAIASGQSILQWSSDKQMIFTWRFGDSTFTH